MPDSYNAIDCLQQVDVDVIQEIMDAIGGEDLIRFVSTDYAARAQQVFDLLRLPPVTLHNVWEVFQKNDAYSVSTIDSGQNFIDTCRWTKELNASLFYLVF